MFQSFDVSSTPEQGPPRLAALRAQMAEERLDGWLVPRADAWQGETVAPCDERLAWLTGFTGSAGFAAVLGDEAGVFVDGRYRVQVRAQVADVFTPVNWPEVKLTDWLAERLGDGARIGFDPWLHTVAEVAELRKALDRKGIALVPMETLIDRIWEDRPARPSAPMRAYPDEMAGRTSAEKRAEIAATLKSDGQRVAILTTPHSIAWLLNIRGADIARDPIAHGFALVFEDGAVQLFCDPAKAAPVTEHLGPEVTVLPEEGLLAALQQLDGPVRLDPKSCPEVLRARLEELGTEVSEGADPCLLPKAKKTDAEVQGARDAGARDALAMIRFLHWLDETAPGGLTEIDVATKLEGFRRENNALLDISFETISGAGPNAALPHYRVSTASNRELRAGEVILVDSGGQYLDGTTDITRTMAVGEMPEEVRRAYTLVLQGVVAVSRARFPKGVGGAHLDALARVPLWSAGMDYDHGTGHGIGAYLAVHEGPQSLSRRSTLAFEPGMIVSNEPGYYREGSFGIRIENLIAVREAPAIEGQDDRPWRDFETLTFVPFDRRLIVTAMLTEGERDWINAYHADTLARSGPKLDGAVLDWLTAACAPI